MRYRKAFTLVELLVVMAVIGFHPAGTNFLAADGSVKLIAERIDERVYHALCTRAAGDVVGTY